MRVVLDLDVSTELAHESVECVGVCCPHVRSGDDAERRAAFSTSSKFRLEQSQSVPLDEGTQQVDLVGRVQLCFELGAETRFTSRIRQERRFRQRRRRANPFVGDHAGAVVARRAVS